MGLLDDLLGDVDTDTTEKEYELIPKGKYLCKLTDAYYDTLGDKNIPIVGLEFTITSGDFKNRKLWQKIWFSQPNTDGQKVSMTISIKALGVSKECDSSDWDVFAKNVCDHCQSLVEAQTFQVQVYGHREYNGKYYEQASVQAMVNESEVHKGVQNKAPQTGPETSFDVDEEIPF